MNALQFSRSRKQFVLFFVKWLVYTDIPQKTTIDILTAYLNYER